MSASPERQLEFLQDVQRILEAGLFTASYKYALLLALADLAVEKGDDSGGELRIRLDDIAEKFISYYWRQAKPYPIANAVLQQNTGQQAQIITLVTHHAHPTLAQLRRDRAYRSLLTSTRNTIKQMPLWKLQRLGDQVHEVLYDHRLDDDGCITLKPGVAFCLRRFHGLIKDLVTGAWVRFVRSLPANQGLLGEAGDMTDFMFGTERGSLERLRPILVDVQENTCFYCERSLQSVPDVDHFIPWARYSIDLGHNFVACHPVCNRQKKERLAAIPHLERWARRNDDNGRELSERFTTGSIVHDLETSHRVACWAYGQVEASKGLVWTRADEVVDLHSHWREVLNCSV